MKSPSLFWIALLATALYLGVASKKAGAWGGILFMSILAFVLFYEKRRR